MSTQNIYSNTVVIVGGTGTDDIARPMDRMRSRASNPVLWQRFVGGVSANVARGIADVLRAHLITAIGNDTSGQALVAKLRDENITVEPFSVPNSSTGSYTAVLDERGELFVGLSDFKAIEMLKSEHVAERLPSSKHIDSAGKTLRAIILDANLSEQCITETVNTLPLADMRVFALTVSPAKAIRWLPVASKVHVLFCNRAEAAALTSLPRCSPLDQLADGLADVGFSQFVVSDGGSPALVQEFKHTESDLLVQGDAHAPIVRHWISVKALPDNVETLSTVNGAGDAMAAATIANYIAHSKVSLVEALKNSGMLAAVDILSGERMPLFID